MKKSKPQKDSKFPALKDTTFNWGNAEWARAFLPQIRVASLVIQRDDKKLEKVMEAYIENGTVTELLEAWCDTADHLESVSKLLNCAMERSITVLRRLGYASDKRRRDARKEFASMKPQAKVTARRHGGELAIAEQQSPPINLVAADAHFGFQDSDLASLAVVLMRGDFMAPILLDGDYALVDTKQTELDIGGIFAALYEQSVVLMRLQPIYGSGRSTRSTGRVSRVRPNPAYGSDELTLGEDIKIVGRVVQKVTRHL